MEIVRGNYPGLIKYVDRAYPPLLYRHGVGGKEFSSSWSEY